VYNCKVFLVPDEQYLRLFDIYWQQRLTKDEALAAKLRSLGFDPDKI